MCSGDFFISVDSFLNCHFKLITAERESASPLLKETQMGELCNILRGRIVASEKANLLETVQVHAFLD